MNTYFYFRRFIKKQIVLPYAHHFYRMLPKSREDRGTRSIVAESWVLGDQNAEVFFGYHDKTPFSENNDRILAMRTEVDGTDANSECTPMEIGIFPLSDNYTPGVFQPLSQTTTWCWQQGCMLQWDPKDAQNNFYFNDLVEGAYGAKLFSIQQNKEVNQFPFPIYAIHPEGTAALTLNFSRLGRLRPGYGYNLLPDQTELLEAPEGDGLFLADLETKKTKLLIDLRFLAEQVESGISSHHYINHPAFSPDGSAVTFFHIWTLPGVNQRKIRLMQLTLESGELRVLEEERTPSHFAWQDDEHLLVTTRDRELTWRFTRYHLPTGKAEDLKLQFKEDGHPMFHPQHSEIMLSDSYPDKRRDQHLYVTDLSTNRTSHIHHFYSPYKFQGQQRCDLHPRWDREGNAIVVDTAKSGRRQMVILRLKSHARDSIK